MNNPNPNPPPQPTIEAVHANVGFANTYRMEVIKTMLTIATALLAFTVSFRPRLIHTEWECTMILAWIALSLSLLCGIATMYCWELFFISHRDLRDDIPAGKVYRKKVNRYRKVVFTLQVLGFIVGIGGVAWFSAANIDNVRVSASADEN